MKSIFMAFIQGIFVAAILDLIGLNYTQPLWWCLMIPMNVFLSLITSKLTEKN